ncbi:hypothetical protein ID866_9645 [Astraeus odoratus]|nr:hypothetical protein ID866_9645 [Astraeus odoratus]
MATFSRATFNVASYASSRPTYPRALYEFIFDFHRRRTAPGGGSGGNARWERAVDLGCGTGQATQELTCFRHVIGVDPSENMVQSAREAMLAKHNPPSVEEASDKTTITGASNHVTAEPRMTHSSIEFVQAPAEDLGFLEDECVDLIYSEFRFPAYPQLTPLIVHYAESTVDPTTSVGPYWQQPGRSILTNHLVDVPEPNGEVFEPLERVYFTGYLHTWSALHTFKEQHPEDALHPEGPLEVRFWNALRRGTVQPPVNGAGGSGRVGDGVEGIPLVDPNEEVEVDWGIALILARKKENA